MRKVKNDTPRNWYVELLRPNGSIICTTFTTGTLEDAHRVGKAMLDELTPRPRNVAIECRTMIAGARA